MSDVSAGPSRHTNSYGGLAMALGQLVVTLAFTLTTVYLLAVQVPVPDSLWTLNVAIVSFYLGQRVPLARPG